MPVTPDVLRRKMVIAREWQRVDPKFLDGEEQEFWGEIAGRQLRFEDRTAFVEKLTQRGASKRAMEKFLSTAAAQNPNRRLRLIALADRRIALQATDDDRRKVATWVVDNSSDLTHLEAQIERIWPQLVEREIEAREKKPEEKT